ncbi:MAG: ammonia-forming cytochrome c nitrite reductase subunit c552 [Anaerolineales bacterium]
MGHPSEPMPVTPDASLCATCHKTTTDEWRASKHGQLGIDCQTCHDSHSQTPRAESVNALCANCHKDTGSSFTHGTHANAGLQCSDCHMSATQAISMAGGLFATGHTFTVGSEACINCHRDTVHTRDTITRLSGGEAGAAIATLEELRKQAQENEQKIKALEAQGTVRLYTGLIQGAIVGVITGGAAAWVVSKRIRYIEVEEEEEEKKADEKDSEEK